MRLLVYFHDDPDGWSSARILYKALNDGSFYKKTNWPKFSNIQWIHIQYGEEAKLTKIHKDDYVVMLDFSVQPFSKMIDIAQTVNGFLWIDHHKSAIEEAKKHKFCESFDNVTCYLKEGFGACYFVHEFFYPNKQPPKWLELVAKADVWKHTNDNATHHIMEFMKTYSKQLRNPQSPIWNRLERNLDSVLKVGKVTYDINLKQTVEFLEKFGFETRIGNYSAICVNMKTNSLPFEQLGYDEKYDIMVAFFYTGSVWTISMFSKKVDVSEIAKKMGGGGHAGAAGFQCDTQTLKRFLKLR